MKRYISFKAVAVGLLFPLLSFALEFKTYTQAGNSLRALLSWAFSVLLAVAVFTLAWGIFKFIANAGDEKARSEGRIRIFWGVIGIFLMLSIWGLVNLLSSIIELDKRPGSSPEILPRMNGNGPTPGPNPAQFGGNL